jgi:PAS domain S-box-containing protein
MPLETADGRRIAVEFVSNVYVVNNKKVIQCNIRDITERKRSQTALQESENRYRTLAESTLDAIIIISQDGRFMYINNQGAATLGKTVEAVRGLLISDVFSPTVAAYMMELINGIFTTGLPIREEILVPSPAGLKSHDAIMIPLKNPDGTVTSILVISRDITDRKRAEVALQQVNKQLNLLSSITRHDILNQLMALKGYLELSHEIIDDPKTLIEYIKKEEQAANTIEHQITFTKDYQELGIAAPEWQNVNASIEKAIAGLPTRDIHVDVDPKAPEIFADPLFEKVFYNLIDNALRYGGADMKTIRVSSQESNANLTILCEDDGVGISDEDKKHLFTRGFGKNTGLGLFLSREILAITGITITENGEPGKGARFEITVPKGMWRMSGANHS